MVNVLRIKQTRELLDAWVPEVKLCSQPRQEGGWRKGEDAPAPRAQRGLQPVRKVVWDKSTLPREH